MLDAPSESKAQCCSIPGNIFNFVLDNGARNVGDGSHSWIAAGAEPTPISLCHDLFIKGGDRMEVNSKQHCFSSETRPSMHGQVRS
jgi:hypothetical protein